MSKITIDNKTYEVKEGKNLLESILSHGLDLPYFCWHPKLGSVGACRQCAVKSFKDEQDKKGKIIMACMEPVKEGTRISISDPEAKKFRAHIIEGLMTNHPHDCPTCDEGGECHLQDMTIMTGHTYRRFRFDKRTFENQYLGPFVHHEMNRCIACYRCVRFYKDYAGGKDLDVFGAHNHVYFGRHADGRLESEFSGNLVEICPTGVFTDKSLKQHYTRKWDLTSAPSICQLCSLGCNTIVGERYNSIRQVRNRYNEEVNGYFICDRGRYGYEYLNSKKRILNIARKKNIPLQEGNGLNFSDTPEEAFDEVSFEEMQTQLKNILHDNRRIIGIGSARTSLESNYALQRFVGKENFYSGMSETDFELNRLASEILRNTSADIYSMKEVEQSDCVLILGEDLTNTAPMLALSVRQSIMQQPMKRMESLKINGWDDKAVREAIQNERGPLFSLTPAETKLDEFCTSFVYQSPEEIAMTGFAIAHFMNNKTPLPENLPQQMKELAKTIAENFLKAEKAVVISGTSCLNEDVLKASALIAQNRSDKAKKTGLVFSFSEANSLGLTLLEGQRLSGLDPRTHENSCLIILENDLFRKTEENTLTSLLKSFNHVVAIEGIHTRTTGYAELVLPAALITEADGHLVNNEGRVQRFFKVHERDKNIRPGYEWVEILDNMHKKIQKTENINFHEYGEEMEKVYPIFAGLSELQIPKDFQQGAQFIPREPHRYSGRTAMHADKTMDEPTPPVDQNNPMTFTMEGFHGIPTAPLTPFFRSPGWNSIQALNQYQTEVGGMLKRGFPQLAVFKKSAKASSGIKDYRYRGIGGDHKLKYDIRPLYHLYGSEELSVLEGAAKELVPKPFIVVNSSFAAEMGWDETTVLTLDDGSLREGLPLKISNHFPEGAIGVPFGLPMMPYVDAKKWGREGSWKVK